MQYWFLKYGIFRDKSRTKGVENKMNSRDILKAEVITRGYYCGVATGLGGREKKRGGESTGCRTDASFPG